MNRIINIFSGCMVEVNCAETKIFIHYSKGVFTSKGGRTLHAMAVVGFGTVRGIDMWIVRKGWSAKWGDKVVFFVTKCAVCSPLLFYLISINSIPRATFLWNAARTRAASPTWSFVR